MSRTATPKEHSAVLAAITAHDASQPFVTHVQLADALIWLKDELIRTIAPGAVQKEYLGKSALSRLFKISMHAVNRVIDANRIAYKRKPGGALVYKVTDFENAYKANNA